MAGTASLASGAFAMFAMWAAFAAMARASSSVATLVACATVATAMAMFPARGAFAAVPKQTPKGPSVSAAVAIARFPAVAAFADLPASRPTATISAAAAMFAGRAAFAAISFGALAFATSRLLTRARFPAMPHPWCSVRRAVAWLRDRIGAEHQQERAAQRNDRDDESARDAR